MNTKPHRQIIGATSSASRSQVSNGTRLLANVDGRSSSARRFRDLCHAYETEIGGMLSELERGMIKQAASLSLRAEQMQSAVVNGDAVDDDALVRLSGEARRILSSLRTKAAKRKPAGRSLADHIAQRAARAEPVVG